MLCITRKIGERVYIGEQVCVTVLDVQRNGAVKLGIDAPADLRILREELREKEQNRDGGTDRDP